MLKTNEYKVKIRLTEPLNMVDQDKQGGFLYDYVIKTFLKEAVKEVSGSSMKLEIERTCFIKPRRLRINAIDVAPIDTEIEFVILLMPGSKLRQDTIQKALSKGWTIGLGCSGSTRSGGRFGVTSYEKVELGDKVKRKKVKIA